MASVEIIDAGQHAPTDLTLASAGIAENSSAGTLVGLLSATDPDAGSRFLYALVAGSGGNDAGNGLVEIIGNQLKVKAGALINFEVNPFLNLNIQVTDNGSPALSFAKAVTVSVLNANEAPTGISIFIAAILENSAGGTVISSLSASDPDAGSLFSYALVAGSGGSDADNSLVEIVGSQLRIKTGALIDYETNPFLNLNIQVTDNGTPALSFTKAVTVNVLNINENPIDLAITSVGITENSAAGTVVGNLSVTDPDGGSGFLYALVAGIDGNDADNGLVEIIGSQVKLRSGASIDYERDKVLNLNIRVSDNGNPALSFTKAVTVSVLNANEAPLDLGLVSTGILENSIAGTLIGNLLATDPDAGTNFSYALVAGSGGNDADNGFVEIVGSQLRVKAGALIDYESNPVLDLNIRVTDSVSPALSFTKSIAVNVINANEIPIHLSIAAAGINENSAAESLIGTLAVNDPDGGSNLSFVLVPGSGGNDLDNGLVEIIGAQVRVKLGALIDYESNPTLNLNIRAIDNDNPALAYTKALTVAVLNVNEAPLGLSLSSDQIKNKSAGGTGIGTLTAIDPDASTSFVYALVAGSGGNDSDNSLVEIVGSQLRVKAGALIDFESNPVLNLVIQVADSGNPALSFTKALTVTVTNINEAPNNIVLPSAGIPENSGAGSVIGTLQASDPNGASIFFYALVAGSGGTDADNSLVEISGSQVRVKSGALIDYDTNPVLNLLIRVADDGSPSLSFTKALSVNVLNANEAPTELGLTSVGIEELGGPGSVIGTLWARDPDAGSSFTFALVAGTGGNDADNQLVEILGSQLKLKAGLSIDYETNPILNLVIQVADSGSPALSLKKAISVNVVNVNEAPTSISLFLSSILENSAAGTLIGNLSATDPDPDSSFSFALVPGTGGSDVDNGLVEIVGNQLKVKPVALIDFETNPFLNLNIRVTDNGSPALLFTKVLEVNVLNVNETPIDLTLASVAIQENSAAGTI